MSTGSIVEIIGAVMDVEFPRDAIPKIYDALKLEETGLKNLRQVTVRVLVI